MQGSGQGFFFIIDKEMRTVMIYSKKSMWLSALAALAVSVAFCALFFLAGCMESQGPTAAGSEDEPTLSVGLATVPSLFAELTITTGLGTPTSMEIAPDGRIFVCDQAGKVNVVKPGTSGFTTFINLNLGITGERGLLGIAFDPDFANTHYVYLYYTVSNDHNRVSRYKESNGVAGSEEQLFNLPKLGQIYHNGGAIHFGADGKLYIAVGDNKTNAPARSTSSTLGKILRINRDGTIPTDNPFYTSASGGNRAIWMKGMRNPFTFAFQPGTGRLFVNDVGEATWEEIDEGVKGADYGWPDAEGSTSNNGSKLPFFTYKSDGTTGGSASLTGKECAIIGGAFYNPSTSRFPSDYTGDYFFCDYCAGWIKRIDVSTKSISGFATGLSSPVDLKVSKDGYLYYLQHGGELKRITYTGSTAPSIASQPSSVTVTVGGSATFTVQANGSSPLTYQWQRSQVNISGATSASYTRTNIQSTDNGTKYRCVVKNSAGTATSSEATLTVSTNKPPTAKVTSPLSGTTYKAGQTISYAGTGTDPEDGTLPASSFTWTVHFQHDAHFHPFLGPISGSKTGSFTTPTVTEVSPNVWFRIILEVKDSKGAIDMDSIDVHPVTSTFTLAASPTGLQLKLDGQPVTAPKTITGVVGVQRTIEAVSPQTLSGKTYVFSSWSDGGARSHNISTPAMATTYTATFKLATAYEAENAGAKSGVVVASSNAGFTGTGYCDYQNASGDFVEWTVNAATAGTHALIFRFANASTTSRPLKITVNGTVVNSSMAFPPTGSWTSWMTVTQNATLNAGSNKVRATDIGSSGPNMDNLVVP
jgi:glucose/arabinose dehydrogenase